MEKYQKKHLANTMELNKVVQIAKEEWYDLNQLQFHR